MPRPGVTVSLIDSPPTRPVPSDVSTGFMVAVTASGSSAAAELVTSHAGYVAEYGVRTAAENGYDAAESFFREGGSRLYVAKLVDALPSEQDVEDALELFGADLGPGQVFAPGLTTAAIHDELLDHAAATNRRALLDGADTGVVADHVLAAEALQLNSNARFGALWAGTYPVIRGVTPGTTRTVAPSGIVAGLIARSDRSKSPNVAAAGSQQAPVSVTDLSRAFTRDEGETLNDDNVNIFRDNYGVIQNYGFRSLAVEADDPAWYQFSNSRLVMAVVAKATAVAERYLFAQVDGGRRKLAQFEGDLVAEAFLPYFNAGSLYGETAAEAFSVDATSVEANPDSELALGNVRALCAMRPSPFAEAITIEITSAPITTPVAG